ncbi:MAG: hypothetical protein AAGC65_21140 [Mucilaginibacter sp.]
MMRAKIAIIVYGESRDKSQESRYFFSKETIRKEQEIRVKNQEKDKVTFLQL